MNTKIKMFQVSVALLVSGIIATPAQAADKIVYPIQEISKLECRFQDFDTLSSSCKQTLPTLNTKDYKKYATKNGGYNDFTRIYTVLWGASYKYGWDQGNGGHQWVDIATAKGTPVYAMADGKVIVSSTELGWGQVVSVEHNINGRKVVSNYAHLSKIQAKKWDFVTAGEKIGEVWSTGNSTGNHLHFQIDFDAPFYPYYYSQKTCPYSYFEIVEKGVCFDELARNTIDPLLFLETNGAILDQMRVSLVSSNKNSKSTKSQKTTTPKNTTKASSVGIFYTYVYKESPSEDISKLQELMRELWIYKGKISGDYEDIENTIIRYQIERGVIENPSSLWAGYWGPKTRATAKVDYDSYLTKSETTIAKEPSVVASRSVETKEEEKEEEALQTVVAAPIVTQKISRVGLLSREEIEAREIDEFLNTHDISFKNTSRLNQVEVGKTTKFTIEVKTTRGRDYRGTTPRGISFDIDTSVATPFPTEVFYIQNGQRDISISGVKQGTVNLKIKLGDRVLKTIPVRVGNAKQTQERKSLGVTAGKLFVTSSIVTGEAKTGIVLLRDNLGTKLIKQEFEGRFAINSQADVRFCIKKWELKNIRSIYNRDCKETEYQDHLVYDYDDTVAGLLIFDYKTFDRNTRLELVKVDEKKTLHAKNLRVTTPKGLHSSYKYYDEIVSTLEKGVTGWVERGYFQEEKRLSQYDANIWIRNTLTTIKNETSDPTTQGKIAQKILEISKNLWSERQDITRGQFLEQATQYLVIDKDLIERGSIDYRDVDEETEQKAEIFFDEGRTWKDKFGKSYFRPDSFITRWEGAYFVAIALEKNRKILLASR